MDKVIKNYEEPLERSATTKEYIKFLKHKRKNKKANKKFLKLQKSGKVADCGHDHSQDIQNQHQDHEHNNPPTNDKIFKFAIVVEDVVVDIMNVQQGFADILNKEPRFIEIKEGEHIPHQGYIYKDGEFVDFRTIIDAAHPTSRG